MEMKSLMYRLYQKPCDWMEFSRKKQPLRIMHGKKQSPAKKTENLEANELCAGAY